jgi:hypothetical protein
MIKIIVIEIEKEKFMKSMIWHPEEKDEKVNQYLAQTNHAPYEVIIATILGICCVFTLLILMGTF